jgi:hypothetical protein
MYVRRVLLWMHLFTGVLVGRDACSHDGMRGYGALAHWRGFGFESLAAPATPRQQSCMSR